MQPSKVHPKGRLAGYKDPFNPNPNPDFGHAIDEKTGMRTGLTCQEYMRLYRLGKGQVRPIHPLKLDPSEIAVIAAYVKTPPKDLTEDQKADLAAYIADHP